MRQIKIAFMMVGVALSVAPIFSVVSAQQGNTQAQMLLEMQALRQEISELRDMVERQQYQLRKLQRASTGTPAVNPNTSYSAPAVGTGAQGSQGGQFGTVGEIGSLPSATGQSGALQGQVYQDSSAGQRTPGDFYQPYTPDQVPSTTEQGSINGVEERVITAPRVSGPVTDYPPVVDRSIGGSPSVPVEEFPVSEAAEGGEAVAGQWRSTAPSTTQYQNRPTQTTPQVDRGSVNVPIAGTVPPGGVIAIPQVEQSNTQPQVSTPDQQVAVAPIEQPSETQAIQTSLSETDYYGQGFDLLKQSKYEQAATVFEQQLKAYPQGDLADDAHYWIAEAMHVSRKLDVAKQHLKAIIQNYPQSRRLPDAMLKTAYIEQQQGNEIEARILFQEIVNYHPKSDAAIAAKNRLAASN